MDIAALSTAMSQMNAGTQIGVALTKMSLDTAEQTGNALTKMMDEMETSVNPNLGSSINVRL